jgi:hypothetical protein
MMFDCPTLATARLQYHAVFGAHVEMKAAFTHPLIAAPLASFVHNHVTVPHHETNTSRFSQVTMSTMSYWPCLACMLE